MLEKYPMETMELSPWQAAFFEACGKGDLAAMKALLAEHDVEELRRVGTNRRGWACQLSTQAFYNIYFSHILILLAKPQKGAAITILKVLKVGAILIDLIKTHLLRQVEFHVVKLIGGIVSE